MSYMALPCIAFTPHHYSQLHYRIGHCPPLYRTVLYYSLCHCTFLYSAALPSVIPCDRLNQAGRCRTSSQSTSSNLLWLWTASSLPTPCPQGSTTQARSPKYSILSPIAKVNTDINNCQDVGFTAGFRTFGKLQNHSQIRVTEVHGVSSR